MKRKSISKLVASVLIGSSLIMAGGTTSVFAETNNTSVANSEVIMLSKSNIPSGYTWIRDIGFNCGINVGWNNKDKMVVFKDCYGNKKEVSIHFLTSEKYKGKLIGDKVYMDILVFFRLMEDLNLQTSYN